MGKQQLDDDVLDVRAFTFNQSVNASKLTFFGQGTNPKIIFKNYRMIFESVEQITAILEQIPGNSMLVINETNMNARFESIVWYYQM